MTERTKVGVVGAGFIARDHLDALRCLKREVEVRALCDLDRGRADRLARSFGVPAVYEDLEAMLAGEALDAVHILVPPAAHHDVAARCLEAGLHVLVEKPLGLEREEMERLGARARDKGVFLGVNHNMTHVPAFRRLKADLARGALGRLEHLTVTHNTPLRQLVTGDVSHFMFQTDANILWEQGIHLFSTIQDLLGPCEGMTAQADGRLALPNGTTFTTRWHLQLRCARGTAGVYMSYGRTMPETSVEAIGTDGWARVDLVRSAYQLLGKSRWLDFLDQGLGLVRAGGGLIARGLGAVAGYGLALFKLVPPSDPFSRGMLGSLRAFHRALREGQEPPLGLTAALEAGHMCELAAAAAGASREPAPTPELPEPGPARPGEVLVTGGTGFIGRALVPRLRAAGHPVTLLVRRPALLHPDLRDPEIRLFTGDAMDPEAVDKAAAGVRRVIHMATCAASDPSQMEVAMAKGVEVIGEACRREKVERLLFISSTAAIYLGGESPVTGACGPDPRPQDRPEYARGKIAAEHALARLVAERGLKAVVLRPAIVVGAGGLAEHSGVGLWVRDNHCVGWGRGRNPLPFVLVEECADAIVAAVDAPGIDGRAYNLAGDVRLSGREYMETLRAETGRGYHHHPTSLRSIWAQEYGKWLVKAAARKPGEPMRMRDLRSRAFLAPLDCGDAKADLGWRPTSDRETFVDRAIRVHR